MLNIPWADQEGDRGFTPTNFKNVRYCNDKICRSIVGIMPVVNLHQWDTQLENLVLPLFFYIILLHIQITQIIKVTGISMELQGYWKVKKQYISTPMISVLFQEYPERFAPKPLSLLVVSPP